MAQERFILTESQLAALEKAKAEKEVQGEFETECPGYCGAQDTFYIGTLKGVGRVYQQTFIDTYAKVASPSSTTARRRSRRPISSTIGSYPSTRSTAWFCSAFSPIEAPNIAAIPSITNTSSISPSRTSTIAAPRQRVRNPMASSNDTPK